MKTQQIIVTLLSLLCLTVLISCNRDSEANAPSSETEGQTTAASSESDEVLTEEQTTATIPETYDVTTETTLEAKQVPYLEYVTITDFEVDVMHLGAVSCGYACVVLVDRGESEFAFVNLAGEILNNARFAFAESFCSNSAYVELSDGRCGYIDLEGEFTEIVDDRQTRNVSLFASLPGDRFGSVTVYEEGEECYGLQDAFGNRITEPIFCYIDWFSSGERCTFAIHEDGRSVMLYPNGDMMLLPEGTGYAYVRKDRIYCENIENGDNPIVQTILDMTGNPLLPKCYSMIMDCENGYYLVIDEGHLGLLDYETCEVVFEPSLPCDWSIDMNIGYGEGYLTVCKDGRLAFVKFVVEEES